MTVEGVVNEQNVNFLVFLLTQTVNSSNGLKDSVCVDGWFEKHHVVTHTVKVQPEGANSICG